MAMDFILPAADFISRGAALSRMRWAPWLRSAYSAARLSCGAQKGRSLAGLVVGVSATDSATSSGSGVSLERKQSWATALLIWSSMEVASSMRIRIYLRYPPPQMYRPGRGDESQMSSLAVAGPRRSGSAVTSIGPIWALSVKLLGAVFASAIEDCGGVRDRVGSFVCPLFFAPRSGAMMCRSRFFPPGAMDPADSFLRVGVGVSPSFRSCLDSDGFG